MVGQSNLEMGPPTHPVLSLLQPLRPGTLVEPESQNHTQNSGKRSHAFWTTRTVKHLHHWTTLPLKLCWFHNGQHKMHSKCSINEAIGTCEPLPLSWRQSSAKFVTSCLSLTTREQPRYLYPRTPAHTRIVSWKHLSGFKLYSLYAWSFSPSKKCSNKNHDNKNFLHSTTVPFGSTWIKWYVRFMKWQDHLRIYSLWVRLPKNGLNYSHAMDFSKTNIVSFIGSSHVYPS